jgi:hypothetical protein
VVGGLVVGSQKFAKAAKKFDFGRCKQCVVKDRDHFKPNVVNLFLSSFLFVFWYHSLNCLDKKAFLQDSAIDS